MKIFRVAHGNYYGKNRESVLQNFCENPHEIRFFRDEQQARDYYNSVETEAHARKLDHRQYLFDGVKEIEYGEVDESEIREGIDITRLTENDLSYLFEDAGVWYCVDSACPVIYNAVYRIRETTKEGAQLTHDTLYANYGDAYLDIEYFERDDRNDPDRKGVIYDIIEEEEK